jgi:peptidoglycan/xylan/chitin deacetylase (PgdA/CDA1 family)
MYHKVDRIPPGARHLGNYVLPEAFQAQLTALKDWNYEPVSFEQWLAYREGKARLPRRPLIITFDDGYRSTYEIAWPALKRSGFPATVFLVSDLIGKTNLWDVDELQEPLLNEREIREMQAGGMTFGSHTRTHPALTKLSREQASGELRDSRRALESLLDEPVTTLCYPYAKQNSTVRELAREAGYRAAVIGKGGTNRVWADRYALRRIKVDSETTIPRFRRTLARGRWLP